MSHIQKSKVVVVTPGQLAMNPRTVKEATALSYAGYEVHVIASRLTNEMEERDQDIIRNAPFTLTRIDYTKFGARILDALFNACARWLARFWPGSFFLAGFAHSRLTRRLLAETRKISADLYIAHYPAALPGVVSAARRNGASYAYDAEDFHLGDLPDKPDSILPNLWIHAIESTTLPRAVYVSAAAPLIADAYAREYGITKPTVIRNVFPRQEAPDSFNKEGVERPRPSLYWFSQVRGRDRGLECALKAVAIAKCKPHFYVRGTPQAGFDELLYALADELGCRDRIHLLKPAPPSEMIKQASRFDVGLVGETGNTRNRQIALTNKQFTYILAGIPAIMTDIPAHRDFATEANKACRLYRTDNPASLAQVLDELLGNTEALADARSEAFKLGQQALNWETEVPKLLECIAKTL